MMDERERYIAALTFQPTDRIPFHPGGPRESTLARWHQEGLPQGKNYMEALCETIGMELPPTKSYTNPGMVFSMIPQFDEKVLDHRDGHYVVQDWMDGLEIMDVSLESPDLTLPGRVFPLQIFLYPRTTELTEAPDAIDITKDEDREGDRPAQYSARPGQLSNISTL